MLVQNMLKQPACASMLGDYILLLPLTPCSLPCSVMVACCCLPLPAPLLPFLLYLHCCSHLSFLFFTFYTLLSYTALCTTYL